jgi:hypothetical protein
LKVRSFERSSDRYAPGFPPKDILYTLGERRWKGELDQLTKLNGKQRAKWWG